MNDWQKLYVLVKNVNPVALAAMARIRLAESSGEISSGEAWVALAAGERAIARLLEEDVNTPAMAEFTEDFGVIQLQ